jgi:hypothetical protein
VIFASASLACLLLLMSFFTVGCLICYVTADYNNLECSRKLEGLFLKTLFTTFCTIGLTLFVLLASILYSLLTWILS